jgi:hypothetical protein
VETGVLGTVIATFTDPEISDEIIAVKFDDGFETMAFPTDDLRRVWAH